MALNRTPRYSAATLTRTVTYKTKSVYCLIVSRVCFVHGGVHGRGSVDVDVDWSEAVALCRRGGWTPQVGEVADGVKQAID